MQGLTTGKFQQQYDRNVEYVEELAKCHPGQTILIVAHTGVLKVFFTGQLKVPFPNPAGFQCLMLLSTLFLSVVTPGGWIHGVIYAIYSDSFPAETVPD